MLIRTLHKRLPIRQITTLPSIPSSQSTSFLLFSIPSNKPDLKTQHKKTNLGQILDHLREVIPDALHKVPDSKFLDDDILLRVAPSITNLPILKGRRSYLTTLKATQFLLTNFLLNPKVKLHITDIKVLDKGGFSSNIGTSGYGVYEWSTKIVFKWRTCLDECEHLVESSSSAKQGLHILNKLDIQKLWGGGYNQDFIKKYEDGQFERVLNGIFVFELDANCEKILVHNLENLEMYDKKDFIDIDDLARV